MHDAAFVREVQRSRDARGNRHGCAHRQRPNAQSLLHRRAIDELHREPEQAHAASRAGSLAEPSNDVGMLHARHQAAFAQEASERTFAQRQARRQHLERNRRAVGLALVVKVVDLVEKPNAKDAPSNYAVIGRYLFDPAVFEVLEKTKPGKNGEIQLTDAMKTLAKDVKKELGGGLHAVIFKGRRYDTGDKLSYLQSVVQLASEREDLGPAFKKWLKTFVNNLGN